VLCATDKANFPLPRGIQMSPVRDVGTDRAGRRGDGIYPPVINLSAPIGSLLIFLEATYHTTLPWTCRDHPRRSLLYRYSAASLHYASELYATGQPSWVSELSDEQQAVLEPPGIRRPELEARMGTLTAPLAQTRITHPTEQQAVEQQPHPPNSCHRNPTGSKSYQATRGGNEDG
jgi:hypothetical protein